MTTEKKSPKRAKKMALQPIALALSIAALVVSGITYSVLTRDQASKTDVQNLARTVVTLSANMVHRQDHLQQEVIALHANMPLEAQKTFAEVNYLIDIANTQLSVDYDVKAALRTLQTAQDLLASTHDPRFMQLAAAIQTDREALTKVSPADQSDVFAALSTIMQKVKTISLLPPAHKIVLNTTLPKTDAAKPWYQKLGDGLLQLKSLVVIRHVDQNNPPLVAPDMENYLRQNIVAQLTMAQWAVLHHNQAIYEGTLKNATAWVNQYFSLAAEKEAVSARLKKLAEANVAPKLPTLSKTMKALADVDLDRSVADAEVILPKAPAKKIPPPAKKPAHKKAKPAATQKTEA